MLSGGKEGLWDRMHTHPVLWSASETKRDSAVLQCPKSERPFNCAWCNVCLCGVKYAHIKTLSFRLSLSLYDIIKKGPVHNNSYSFQPDFKCYGVYGWKLATALSYLALCVYLFVKHSSHHAHHKTSGFAPERRGRMPWNCCDRGHVQYMKWDTTDFKRLIANNDVYILWSQVKRFSELNFNKDRFVICFGVY